MADILMSYMAINVVVTEQDMNFECWLSTVDQWKNDAFNHPFQYTYIGDRCTWLIHSNYQLTSKILAMAGEQADRLCAAQAKINDRRVAVNRK